MFEADSALVTSVTASPNHDPRTGDRVDILILHYTAVKQDWKDAEVTVTYSKK